jgi:hypothetical protein
VTRIVAVGPVGVTAQGWSDGHGAGLVGGHGAGLVGVTVQDFVGVTVQESG